MKHYVVAMMIEGAALFANDRLKEPANTYAEEYEEERKAEALAYFWQSVTFAMVKMNELAGQGVTLYRIRLYEFDGPTENQEADEKNGPSRTIYTIDLRPSGAAMVTEDISGGEEPIAEGMARATAERFAILSEPLTEEQRKDAEQWTKPSPKA